MPNDPMPASADSPQGAFFARSMYAVQVDGWPPDLVYPPQPLDGDVPAPPDARLRMWPIDSSEQGHVPPVGATVVDTTGSFSLRHSGNLTLMAPKRSWKAELEDGVEVAEMETINLKSMYNDAAQMREALAWWLFAQAKVPASRHTYARLVINGRFLGLFSVIEQPDKPFLAERFAGRPRGNLYKIFVGALGPGSLEHRVGLDGDDSGRQYQIDGDQQTYRLHKSYSDAPDAESFEDLAQLVRVINGIGLPGGGQKFGTDRFADSVRDILAVEAFLRWAGVNTLTGSWDNYFATPANYYLYNGTKTPGSPDVVGEPYFTFIPWDYDNTFGIDYFGAPAWQYADLLDWSASTEAYWVFNGRPGQRSRIPLVQNLFANADFRRYYLDHLEHLLDTVFSPDAVRTRIGLTGDPGLWGRVTPGAYLESDAPNGAPFTGRQFTNHEVYLGGFAQQELRHGNAFVPGVEHYVRMRYDSARAQLKDLRQRDPSGSSGASFGGSE